MLGNLRQNYDATNQFISRYQTFEFNKLNPEIQIKIYDGEYDEEIKSFLGEQEYKIYKSQTYSPYALYIRITLKQLGYYNVNFEKMVEYIKADNSIISYIVPIIEKDDILMLVLSDSSMKRAQSIMLTSYLLDK